MKNHQNNKNLLLNNNKIKLNRFQLKQKKHQFKLMMMMIFKNRLIKLSIKINQQHKQKKQRNEYYNK